MEPEPETPPELEALEAAVARLAARREEVKRARGDSPFRRSARLLREQPKRTRRRERRERIARNKARRALWLQFSHKKERERWGEFDRKFRSVGAREARFGSEHYDMDGWPMSMRSWMWVKWLQGRNEMARHVACTKVSDDPCVWVSTVWLGLDHGYNFEGRIDYKPIIFETMIFGGPLDQEYQTRYCTKEEALRGHELACKIAERPELQEQLEAAEEDA